MFDDYYIAWLSVFIATTFRETVEFSNTILTEPSYMMASGIFLFSWLLAWQKNKMSLWFLSGLALGIVAHVKPAWNALLPSFIIFSSFLLILRLISINTILKSVLPFVFGCCLIALPLFIRNVIQLNYYGLSDPSYFGASLAHRVAYDSMSWTEWFAGWVYYLPDFGDTLSAKIFGDNVISKLGWGENSYYVYGRDVLHSAAIEATSASQASYYLISNHIANNVIKYFFVTLLLSWRGIFLSKYLGLLAIILLFPVLYYINSVTRRKILILITPIVLMVGVNALVSVSISRYNLPLIIIYSILLSYILVIASRLVTNQLPIGLRTKIYKFFPKKG
jgi:hypothetical protein